MVLTCDAETITFIGNDTKESILNKSVLEKIEDDLDIDEKISILFLMTQDYACAFEEVYTLLQKFKEQKVYIITKYIESHPENWKDKLLEAICILENRQIIRKLGISFSDLELIYIPKFRLKARNLNPVAKCLYMLCEAFSESQIKLLLQYVKKDFIEYESDLENIDYLELHMLYWMNKKYISIYSDGRVNLKNLMKHLKTFDEVALIYEDLKKYENKQNVLDTHNVTASSASNLQTFCPSEEVHSSTNLDKEDIRKIKKGLCIIISQMYFSGQTYETRFGTLADCMNLRQTFEGFGFKVSVFQNLKRHEMLEKIENISKEYGSDYDCIFVCILSHGCKGGIIASDEQEVTIEMIEHKMCCLELKDVMKIVIIQACQGKLTGQAKNSLTTDGLDLRNISSIMQYRNFCIFMSTMQGFVSVRHKEQGSWFIQEFCNVLQSSGNKLTFSQAVRRIIQSVEKKRGKLDGEDFIAQLPELRPYRLLTDFQLPEYCAHTP